MATDTKSKARVASSSTAILDALAAVMQNSAQNAEWTKTDTQIKYEGKEIVLPNTPAPMQVETAIETLERYKKQEDQEFDVREHVAGAPWDTLYAVYRAMQSIYGVVMAESIQTFFGEIKPDFITVKTGVSPEDQIQVPNGKMALPGVEQPVYLQMQRDGTIIAGTVRRRDRAILVEIANRARAIIQQDSIYKSKAIRINVDEDGDLVLSQQPEFLDLSAVHEGQLIHNDDTARLIQTNIFAPLKHTEACRKNKVPLKRGILLEGKYGTGKSLTSRVTAKVATDNGWTFIMLNRSQGLRAAIEFARNYQPCVIFAEDIDRAADREDEDVNDLVNLLDGLISKDMEMMTVLTTNFIENIDKSLLRPGRFDAIISIGAPDAKTAEKILRVYAGNLLDKGEDLGDVGIATEGMIPASIREVVERAKLSMLTEGRVHLSADDLYISAVGMQHHMKLLEPKPAEKSAAERFTQAFQELLNQQDEEDNEEVLDNINSLCRTANRTEDQVDSLRRDTRKLTDIASAGAEASNKTLKTALSVHTRTGDILNKLDTMS